MKRGRPRGFDEAEVLSTAMELFWEKGFENTTKRELMEATGLSSQSLYGAFGDKRELFLKGVRHYADLRYERLAGLLERPGPVLENFRAFGQLVLDDRHASEKGCLLANAMGEFGCKDSELQAAMQAQLRRVRGAFRAALERGRAEGELRPDTDPETLASLLLAGLTGLSLLRRSGVDAGLCEEVIRGAEALLEGHAAREE